MDKKKPPVTGSIEALENMWKNSNTEQLILKQIKDQYGDYAFRVAKRGTFVVADGIWFLMLDDFFLKEFIKETGKFFFEFQDIKVKVWENNSETIFKWLKSRRELQQWLT